MHTLQRHTPKLRLTNVHDAIRSPPAGFVARLCDPPDRWEDALRGGSEARVQQVQGCRDGLILPNGDRCHHCSVLIGKQNKSNEANEEIEVDKMLKTQMNQGRFYIRFTVFCMHEVEHKAERMLTALAKHSLK